MKKETTTCDQSFHETPDQGGGRRETVSASRFAKSLSGHAVPSQCLRIDAKHFQEDGGRRTQSVKRQVINGVRHIDNGYRRYCAISSLEVGDREKRLVSTEKREQAACISFLKKPAGFLPSKTEKIRENRKQKASYRQHIFLVLLDTMCDDALQHKISGACSQSTLLLWR